MAVLRFQSRRGDSNPQPPVYKKYGSRPERCHDIRSVLKWLARQSDSPIAIPRDPNPVLANPLAIQTSLLGSALPSSATSLARLAGGCRSGGVADDEGPLQTLARVLVFAADGRGEEVPGEPAFGFGGLADRGELGSGPFGFGLVVVAGHRNLCRDLDPHGLQGVEYPDGHDVAEGEDGGGPVSLGHERERGGVPPGPRAGRLNQADSSSVQGEVALLQRSCGADEAATKRPAVPDARLVRTGLEQQEGDPSMAEIEQVLDELVSAGLVIGLDAGDVVGWFGVDQDERHPTAAQLGNLATVGLQ